MPHYHFSHAEKDAEIEKIEESGRTIVSVSSDESGVSVYVAPPKNRKAGQPETRS